MLFKIFLNKKPFESEWLFCSREQVCIIVVIYTDNNLMNINFVFYWVKAGDAAICAARTASSSVFSFSD